VSQPLDYFVALLSGALGLLSILSHASAQIPYAQASPTPPDWTSEIRPTEAGQAVPLQPLQLRFEFGWAEIPAGWIEVSLDFSPATYEVRATGASSGLARSLWKLDAEFFARGQRENFLPDKIRQTERYARHQIDLEANFSANGVRRIRQRTPSSEIAQWRSIELPGLRDLAGVMLFIRSQPLLPGDEIITLCFPGDAPYLVRLRSEGPEIIQWNQTPTPALRLQLSLQRVGTKGEEKGLLLPHRRFRQATIWLANDAQRLPLRARADLIFGYVYGELLPPSGDLSSPEKTSNLNPTP
jgi:hypothetical protein